MGSCQVLAQSTSPTIRALECNVEGELGAPIRERASWRVQLSVYLSLSPPPRPAESAGEKQGHLRCSKSASAPAAWAPPGGLVRTPSWKVAVRIRDANTD